MSTSSSSLVKTLDDKTMLTLSYDIQIGDYKLGMLDQVEIHRSVELLADTATIKLPASQYNKSLEIEDKIKRGDRLSIKLGYKETGLVSEFEGYLLRVATDDGSITLYAEDELFQFRKSVPNGVFKKITLKDLLQKMLASLGGGYELSCSYEWTYDKFVFHSATAYDILRKVQEECGADIYLRGKTLHIHPPSEGFGVERFYDFARNIEKSSLVYRRAEDKKLKVVVKALLPDGKVRELELGSAEGDKIELKSPTSDEASMRRRAETELLRRSFDGYDGSITTWLIPECQPSDTAVLRDKDYTYKDGSYFVRSVKTSMSSEGGKREITLGFRLS